MNETGTRSSNSSAGVYRLSILIICKRNKTQTNNDYFNLAFTFHITCLLFIENFHSIGVTPTLKVRKHKGGITFTGKMFILHFMRVCLLVQKFLGGG
jgi:hypothetical protein